MREERITSRQNPLLRHAKKLLTSRSYRESCGEFAADGTKLLEEAARWVPGLHTVIATDGVELCRLPEETRVVRVPRDVMASVSQMDAPQGAIFLCKIPQPPAAEILPGTLLLDGIQDPGNLGTILRTADALAVPVVLLPGCADVWNPKVVRASMGAAFRAVPVSMTREAAVASCRKNNVRLLATALRADAHDLREETLSQTAVIIGMVYDYFPYMVLPIYSILAKLDIRLLEAARDLGCNGASVLRRVVFPLSVPGVISGVTMVLIPSISTFYISQKLGSGKFFLIGDAIEGQYVANNLHFAAAIAFILMLILLIGMAVMKYFTTKHLYGGD